MKTIEIKSKKSLMKCVMMGMICSICLFTIAQDVVTPTIQLDGGYCVFDDVIEIPFGNNKDIMVSFKYTFEENPTVDALLALFEKGVFLDGKRSYKAKRLSTGKIERVDGKFTLSDAPVYKGMQREIERTGNAILTVHVPVQTKTASLKFVFNKQEIPLKKDDKIN